MKVVLDGKKMTSIKECHRYLKEKFKLADYYGENMDALWDMLSSYDGSLDIELCNEEDMFRAIGGYSEDIISLFEDLTVDREDISFKIII